MAGHILPWIQQSTNQGCIYHKGVEIWSQVSGYLFYVYPSRVKLVQKFFLQVLWMAADLSCKSLFSVSCCQLSSWGMVSHTRTKPEARKGVS